MVGVGLQMNYKMKYILSVLLATVGCMLWYGTDLYPLGILCICIPGIILNHEKLNDPIKLRNTKLNAQSILLALIVLLSLAFFIILLIQIPEERFKVLFKRWYFTGTLWLLMMAAFTFRYLKDEEKAQQASSQGFGG